MFKKTRVRQIIELLQKNLSDREISMFLVSPEIPLHGSDRFLMVTMGNGRNF